MTTVNNGPAITQQANVQAVMEPPGQTGGAPASATYLTADDETATLTSSRQLVAGTGITFDDTTPGEREISASGGGAVDSVNGQTGVVVLDAADVSAQPVDATLTALAGLSSSAGLVEQTGADAFTKRAIGVSASTDILSRADGDGRYAGTGAANTWTLAQTFSANSIFNSGVQLTRTSPGALAAGTTDNYSVSLDAFPVLRLTPDAGGSALSGIVHPTGFVGVMFIICNIGAADLTLLHQNAGSSANNQFKCANDADVVIRKNGAVLCWYDPQEGIIRVVTP